MPIDYSKYPPDWNDIRLTRLAIAGEERDRYGNITKEANCEECGVTNHEFGARCIKTGKFYTFEMCSHGEDIVDGADLPDKGFSIVLTIGHLDHDSENHQICTDRLRAWCQKCHLAYDRPMRIIQRDRKAGQLFLVEPTLYDIG